MQPISAPTPPQPAFTSIVAARVAAREASKTGAACVFTAGNGSFGVRTVRSFFHDTVAVFEFGREMMLNSDQREAIALIGDFDSCTTEPLMISHDGELSPLPDAPLMSGAEFASPNGQPF
jgi:hypothetical protein